MDQPDGAPTAAKRALRDRLLARRAARPAQARTELGLALATAAVGDPRLRTASRVCGYVGVGTEPATGPLLDALRSAGVEVLLPVVAPGGALRWAHYDGPQSLVPAAMGLLEPSGPRLDTSAAAAADLMLVPALGIDRGGNRLGRGGGYYDRMLAGLPPPGRGRPITWGAVFDEEVLEAVPTEPHDVPLDGALTASGRIVLATGLR